jgi:hypothetical protein
MAGWTRIEAMARSLGLSGGLEARVADPLWLLARQWQVGEFKAEDAAQPAVARVSARSVPLTSYRAGTRAPQPLPAGSPLEALAEAVPEPGAGAAGLHASARAGRRLARLFRAAGLPAAIEALAGAFPPASPDHAVSAGPLGTAAADLLVRLGLDGAAIAGADQATVLDALATRLAGAELARAAGVMAGWLAWYRGHGGVDDAPSWDEERQEYRFSVAGAGPDGEVTLVAPGHDGGHLDWPSFDLSRDAAQAHGLGAGRVPVKVTVAVPTPARYAGMPASRWWEFEDGQVHFGDLDAGPADLARLLVAEFATVYGVDMFVVPVTVPVGSLTELRTVEVLDTFGGRTGVPSTAAVDAAAGRQRVWRLFELHGDEVGDAHPAPWLLVAPTLAGGLDGPVLERLALARDEAANLAWGIEHLVEGAQGRAVDRAAAWHAAHPEPPPPTASPAGPGQAWRYRLEATAPPWWVPLRPERIDPAAPPADLSAQVRLRRARMQAWALLGGAQVGPMSELLDPRRPRWLAEERVPAAGMRVERAWQLGRWHDGSPHLWLRWRTGPGRGEASSGVRWDLLDRRDHPAGG